MDWHAFDRGVFVVNVLGIVYDPETRRVLVGRREDDEHLPDLSWCFPGGKPGYDENLETYLKHEIKKKTNLDVAVKNLVFVRSYPANRRFLNLYYYCEVVGGTERAGEKHVENRWVKPADIEALFAKPSPPAPEVVAFLKTLE